MNIDFYNYTGRPETLTKTLGTKTALTGWLRDDFDMMHPTLRIRSENVVTFNYCYVPDFNRYYFVTASTLESKNIYELSLEEDVLMSHRDKILAAVATCTESETGNPYSSARRSVYDMRPETEKLDFPVTGQFSENGSIIMVTLKGKKQ